MVVKTHHLAQAPSSILRLGRYLLLLSQVSWDLIRETGCVAGVDNFWTIVHYLVPPKPSNFSCCPGESLEHSCCNLLSWAFTEPGKCPGSSFEMWLQKRPLEIPKHSQNSQNPQHSEESTLDYMRHPQNVTGSHTRLNCSWHLWIISSHQKSDEFKLEQILSYTF